ncbi:MAG TPA: hypothetical protein VFW05_00175, partial [Verrucomicrobiae bacterium]|nr:hypothetical protein [Verrucomicrobiae bacterium]
MTHYDFDAAGRKIAETNAKLEIIRYTNNAAGDLLSLTDGKNQTTRWNYDQYGHVTNQVDQAGTEIFRYKYDADNRLTNRWSMANSNTYYTYDPVGNLTFVNYSASPDVTFQYDALSRVTNMVDAVGTTKYTYTIGGQLWTEDGPFANDTVTNIFSSRLRVEMDLQQPTGMWTNQFGYDSAKRLTGVTSPAGAFTYTLGATAPASPLIKTLLLPNTSYITNIYDGNARLLGTWLKKNDNTTLDFATYGYNLGNLRIGFTNSIIGSHGYSYDPNGQLIGVISSVRYNYGYDA